MDTFSRKEVAEAETVLLSLQERLQSNFGFAAGAAVPLKRIKGAIDKAKNLDTRIETLLKQASFSAKPQMQTIQTRLSSIIKTLNARYKTQKATNKTVGDMKRKATLSMKTAARLAAAAIAKEADEARAAAEQTIKDDAAAPATKRREAEAEAARVAAANEKARLAAEAVARAEAAMDALVRKPKPGWHTPAPALQTFYDTCYEIREDWEALGWDELDVADQLNQGLLTYMRLAEALAAKAAAQDSDRRVVTEDDIYKASLQPPVAYILEDEANTIWKDLFSEVYKLLCSAPSEMVSEDVSAGAGAGAAAPTGSLKRARSGDEEDSARPLKHGGSRRSRTSRRSRKSRRSRTSRRSRRSRRG
jgi:hypothetical protein